MKKSWIVEFTKELIKENIQINWSLPSGTRSEALDQEVLYLLKETGCKKLTYAPESGSAKTLKRIKKVVKIPRMLKSIRFCVKAGISVKSNIIFGFPGQTLIEVLETYVFMMKAAFVGMNDVSVFSFVPYPGSQLFFELVDSGKIRKDSGEYDLFLTGNILGDVSGIKSWSEHITNRQLKIILISSTLWFYFCQFIFTYYELFLNNDE